MIKKNINNSMSSEFKTLTDFSSINFRNQFPDFLDYSDKECEEHYIIYGTQENPTGLPKNFTVDCYKGLWEDLKDLTNKEVISHYLTKGISEERIYWIPEDFNCEEYKRLNPELQELNELALKEHYIKQGIKLNRTYKLDLPEDFDVNDYRKYNADLSQLTDLQLLQHYSVVGKNDSKRVYKVSLPLDFDPEIYRHFNKDLRLLAPEKLEAHYSLYGKKEGRKYNDPLFDLDFFVSYNKINHYQNYTDYTKDIKQIKSLELYNKITNLSQYQTNGILLVNSSDKTDDSSEFIYNLAKHIKNLTAEKVYVVEKNFDEDRLANYGLSAEDAISYEEDSTLLYYICKNLAPTKILFGFANSQIADVYQQFKDDNRVRLFSPKSKFDLDRFIERAVPDYVFSDTTKSQYGTGKVRVISPILSIKSANLSNESFTFEIENSKQKLDTNRLTIGTHGDFSHKQTYLTFARIARAFPKYNFVWVGGKSTERPETMKDLKNLFFIEEESFSFNLYKLFNYFISLSPNSSSSYPLLENLYLGNKTIAFKIKDSVSYKDPLLTDIHFEYPGEATLENGIEAIKQFVNANASSNKHIVGKQYVEEKFINYDSQLLIDLLSPVDSSGEIKNKVNREINLLASSAIRLKALPLDFDATEYSFLNRDLGNLTAEELEMHYRTEGFTQNRKYKDDLFDKAFCNISYANYLNNVSTYKSKEVKELLDSKIPLFRHKKHPDVILVESSACITNETYTLYSVYNVLKNKYKLSVLIATPEINERKLKQYNIEKSNVWAYKNDLTLLYHFCAFTKPKQIWNVASNFVLEHVVKQLPKRIVTKTISTDFLQIPTSEARVVDIFNKSGQIDLNKITIGSSGLLNQDHHAEIFMSAAKMYPNFNFVWFGDNKILTEEEISNLYHVPDSSVSIELYDVLDYYFVLSNPLNSHSDILINLYLGNAVIAYEDSLTTKFNTQDVSQSFAILKGHITELGFTNAVKTICTSKFDKLSLEGKAYVEKIIQKEEDAIKEYLV